MTDKTQPEALRLAEQYDYGDPATHGNAWKAAVCTELRRQHTSIAELEAEMEAVGAGGVQALSAAPAEADMFWYAEDGECFGHDIDDIISDFGPGDRVKIDCAKRMPSIEVLVVADGDDFTYQIVSPAPPAEQQASPKAPQQAAPADWWRNRADEIEAQVAMTGSPEAMRCYTDMRTLLQAAAGAAPQQEPATVPRFNCWSTNEGDSWFDHPADAQAIYDCLGNDAKVGDEYELTAGWNSVTARYRITEVVGDGEEYEVECISHPQGNTAPQPAPAELEQLRERISRMGLDVDRAMRGHVNEQSPLGTQRLAAIAALAKPAPTPLSEMPYEKRKAIQEGEQISASDAWFHARLNMLDTLDRRNVFRAGFDRGWNAALAAHGGK